MVLLLLFVSLWSFNTHSRGEIVKREILALWDSTETDDGSYTQGPIHLYLEPILNHYGLKLEYVDVGKTFPSKLSSSAYLAKFRGVISWFTDDNLKEAKAYQTWLIKASKQKLPFLFLGDFGFLLETPSKEFPKNFINKALNRFDIEYGGSFYNNPLLFNLEFPIGKKDLEFERALENEVKEIRIVRGLGKSSKPWLKVSIPSENETSWPVIENTKAFYVQSGYEIFVNPTTYQVKWRVNPFKIVEKVFDARTFPAPDVTTLCGRRMLYIHIDGDGFINQSQVDQKSLSGDIILEKIIKKYKLPTTASVVVSEIDPKYLGNPGTVESVKELFSLPYVEPANHTFSHPLSWDMEPTLNEKRIYLSEAKARAHRGPIVAYKIKDYVLDYNREIKGAMEYIYTALTDRTGEEKVVLWSGSCMPPREALQITEASGYLNMNGGDGRLDNTYDSYAGLSALIRQVGPYTQVYTSFANENIYTNLWEGPYSGFKDLIESFRRTELPVRIRPMNIYYHFYSGERKSSLQALEDIYDYASSQEISPVLASDYIKIVHGWRDSKITRVSTDHYRFSNYGHLKTFRIDRENTFPNYKKSRNIIGHNFHAGSLYVHLGGAEVTELVLTSKESTADHIISCNGFVDKVTSSKITGISRVPFEAKIKSGGQDVRLTGKQVGPFSLAKLQEGD